MPDVIPSACGAEVKPWENCCTPKTGESALGDVVDGALIWKAKYVCVSCRLPFRMWRACLHHIHVTPICRQKVMAGGRPDFDVLQTQCRDLARLERAQQYLRDYMKKKYPNGMLRELLRELLIGSRSCEVLDEGMDV